MYICDKAIKDSKNTVNTQSRGTVASGVKEGDTFGKGHQEASTELSVF